MRSVQWEYTLYRKCVSLMQLVKLPKDIAIPDNLTTIEYHELLAYFHFKSEANPSKVEYKRAYKDICAILKK